MASDFKTGSYDIIWPDGAMAPVRIQGEFLMFFDAPVDPLSGALRVSLPPGTSKEHMPAMPGRDDETRHRIEGRTLQLQTPGGVVQLTLTLE
ncbi:hypothetical protein SB751_20310 [Cupriavidus sp. SIMBA_020]|uniref:hypothetical protein n=1 Tax=Cupriavidus sp. SIMBA_020 TaxID=3085766 RepID=UPI00397CB281